MNNTCKQLVKELKGEHPELAFKLGDDFLWSPKNKTILFDNTGDDEIAKCSALLHETAHAVLGHQNYKSDFELVRMEAAAWEKAKSLAKPYGIVIDDDHIQDCLDSYRDWLHKRSLCPDCTLAGIQIDANTYTCIFCYKKWHVTHERFCRPYRKQLDSYPS